jgi:hypothetical protein
LPNHRPSASGYSSADYLGKVIKNATGEHAYIHRRNLPDKKILLKNQ